MPESKKWLRDITMTSHGKKKAFKPGDCITCAARVSGEKEIYTLTDATLDFRLTTGCFTEETVISATT